MKSAPQPVRRNLRAKPAPANISLLTLRSRLLSGFRALTDFHDCWLEIRLASKRRSIGPQVTTFRINTCKSVSKQRTLSVFKMNTYEKHRGRGVALPPPSLNSELLTVDFSGAVRSVNTHVLRGEI